MNVYLIRHPKPDIDAGTCYGSMDLDLEAGWQQDAEQLSSWLFSRLKGYSKSYHSPLKRAALLADYLIPDSIESHSLGELNFGDWEGRLWKDIPQAQIEFWADNIIDSSPYNGESLQALNDRVMSWWSNLLMEMQEHENQPENLILVTHSGVIKVLVSQLCHWPLAQSHLIDPAFLSVTEISINMAPMKDKVARQDLKQTHFVKLKRLGAGDWV